MVTKEEAKNFATKEDLKQYDTQALRRYFRRKLDELRAQH